jgi:small-conductance mechanosensitive channel
MGPNNTGSLISAARRRRELTRAKAIQAIRELDHAGTPVTFEAVARAGGISRSWLYSQSDIRAEIEHLRDATRQAPSPPIPASQRASDPSLRQRLAEATERNRQLTKDNARLRRQLAHALGDQRASPPAVDPLPQSTQPVTLQ